MSTRSLALAAVLLLLGACAPLRESPERVTARFWEALRDGDIEKARSCASEGDASIVEALAEDRVVEEVRLGETLSGESSAIVRTSLVTVSGDARLTPDFDTHLVREAGAWRVDVEETARELTAAILAASVHQIGEALGQGIQDFSEALEQSASEMQEALQEILDELNRELQ